MSDDGNDPVLRARGLYKHYGHGDGLVRAVDGVDLDVARGETVAVMGPSGCGKSTLLHLLGGLDRPTSGEVPTGNLDSAATLDVLRLFDSLHDAGQTLVAVTHDARIAATADRMISMRDGAFVDETRLTGGTTARLGVLAGLED